MAPRTGGRGFASMDPDKQRQIARKGGEASHGGRSGGNVRSTSSSGRSGSSSSSSSGSRTSGTSRGTKRK